MSDVLNRIEALLHQQRETWPLLKRNFDALKGVQVRRFQFDGFEILAQFNPARLSSTGAKTDARSIAARKCFLCPESLPPQQRVEPWEQGYQFLCNPYPIFRDHLTVPAREHRPQRFLPVLNDFLRLVEEVGERFVVFYNGPQCGASAPDHLHFQLGERGFLPLEYEFDRVKKTHGRVLRRGEATVYALDRYLRTAMVIEAASIDAALPALKDVHHAIDAALPNPIEPMINVIGWRNPHGMCIAVLPRTRHRPAIYFAEGDEKLLLSPASVDLGGVCILPIERDFQRLTKELLVRICSEVCLHGPDFDALCRRLGR